MYPATSKTTGGENGCRLTQAVSKTEHDGDHRRDSKHLAKAPIVGKKVHAGAPGELLSKKVEVDENAGGQDAEEHDVEQAQEVHPFAVTLILVPDSLVEIS